MQTILLAALAAPSPGIDINNAQSHCYAVPYANTDSSHRTGQAGGSGRRLIRLGKQRRPGRPSVPAVHRASPSRPQRLPPANSGSDLRPVKTALVGGAIKRSSASMTTCRFRPAAGGFIPTMAIEFLSTRHRENVQGPWLIAGDRSVACSVNVSRRRWPGRRFRPGVIGS